MTKSRPRRALQALADEPHSVEEKRGATQKREQNELASCHRGSIAGYTVLSVRR
jgi:hypothetical protein